MSRTSTTRPEAPPWRRTLVGLLSLAAFALIGAGAGYIAGGAADRAGIELDLALTRGGWAALALLFPAIWLLVVLAHELGHLAGGALAGFRPIMLVAGPLRLLWVEGRPRVELNRSLALAGGVAAAAPDDDRNLIRRMLLMVLGGPLGSLLVGLLAAAALPFTSGLAQALLLIALVLGLMITLVTLLPLRTGGFLTDGARVRMLLRGGPAAERWCASALLVSSAMSGRIRAVDPILVARATALRDGSLDDVGAAFLAYSFHLARGELAAAGAEIDHVVAHQGAYSAGLRPALLIEAAYFAARHRGDAPTARAFLAQTSGSPLVEPYTRARAEAAVLLAEGRPTEARAAAEAGLAALEQARLGALGAIERELLADLR